MEEVDGLEGTAEVVCCPELPEARLVCSCSHGGIAGMIEAQRERGGEEEGKGKT